MEAQSKGPEKQSLILKEAIRITLQTLEDRALIYRNLIIIVVLVLLSSVLALIFSGLWILLTGIVLMVPLCGCFIALDNRKVRHWQAEILDMWQSQNLELDLFKKVMTSFRQVPPQSLKTLLSELSKIEILHQISPSNRAEQVDRLNRLGRNQERKIWIGTALVFLGFISLAAAAIFRSLLLFLSAGAILVLTASFSKLRQTHKSKDLN